MKSSQIKIFLFSIAASFLFAGACQNKTTTTNTDHGSTSTMQTFSSSDDAARAAIDMLKAMASNDKLKEGLNLSADEAGKLAVGKPLPVMEVSYTSLLKENPDSVNASAVLMQQTRMVYPLEIDGKARTSAIVSGSNNAYKLTAAGVAGYVPLLSLEPSGATNFRIVEAPGLSVNFLAYSQNEGTFYVADANVPSARIVKGEPVSESQALSSLAQLARQIDKEHGKEINDKKVVD